MSDPQATPTDCQDDRWATRRLFLVWVVAFAMAVIAYCLYFRLDSPTAATAVEWSFVIIGSSSGSYVFGRAWEYVKRP